jgi:hypothetical protein
MRLRQFIGVILIAFGAYVLVRGFTFKTKETVVDLGPVEARAEEGHTVPPWSGAVIGAVGLLLIVAGSRRRA